MDRNRNHPKIFKASLGLDDATLSNVGKRLMAKGYWCSGKVIQEARSIGYEGELGQGGLESASIILYAVLQHERSGRPHWVLDKDLCECLINTDIPDHFYTELPPIPYEGLYVEVPAGSFVVNNLETGDHEAIGMYICTDVVSNGEGGKPMLGYLIAAIGEIKGITEKGLDDAVLYGWHTAQGDPLGKRFPRLGDATRLALNLLFALSESRLEKEDIDPFGNKSQKKIQRLKSKGYQKHSIISLKGFTGSSLSSGNGTSPRGHIRRGHWNAYWVLNPGDNKIHDKRLREGKAPLYKVYKWIFPTAVKGGGYATPKKVKA